MDRNLLQAYAELIVRKGINPDKEQDVLIIADLDQPEFAAMVAEECYRCGCARVVMEWHYMPMAKLDCQYQSRETMSQVMPWEEAKLKWRADTLPALIWLDSDDPDGMNGTDQAKRAAAQMARFPVIKPYRDAMENKFQWCIAGVPGRKWAKKMFPELPEAEAVEKLWQTIFQVARVNGDACANWDAHNKFLHEHSDKLNAYHFTSLEYKASNGTDFRVGLIPEARFMGGSETDLSGRVFNPNIPSEEIFISPMRGIAEGLLVATKPLSWQGNLIENFSIRFHDGRAVEVHAEKGQEALEKMIAMDDGAARLGECALIANNSPINNTGILFYSTLYDENACCHIALGRGFENCIENYEKYTLEELRAKGINESMIHVDFMIGCPDLDITGITESGERIPVFRRGEWSF